MTLQGGDLPTVLRPFADGWVISRTPGCDGTHLFCACWRATRRETLTRQERGEIERTVMRGNPAELAAGIQDQIRRAELLAGFSATTWSL